MIYILIGVSSFLAYTQGLSRFLFSLQIVILVSISILLQFGNVHLSAIFIPVAQQLVVRNTF